MYMFGSEGVLFKSRVEMFVKDLEGTLGTPSVGLSGDYSAVPLTSDL